MLQKDHCTPGELSLFSFTVTMLLQWQVHSKSNVAFERVPLAIQLVYVETDLKALARLALVVLPMVWFRASNKVLYVGSCATYTVEWNGVIWKGK